MEEKKGFIEWIRANKKELMIAGICIMAIIATVLLCSNRESIIALWDKLKKTLKKSPVNKLAEISMGSIVDATNPTAVNAVEVVVEPVANVVRSLPQNPFEVTAHIRNLPEGWCASADKIATAAEHGYELLQGQTWVKGYIKNEIVA